MTTWKIRDWAERVSHESPSAETREKMAALLARLHAAERVLAETKVGGNNDRLRDALDAYDALVRAQEGGSDGYR